MSLISLAPIDNMMLMQMLTDLGQPVGQGLHHDTAVVVPLSLELLAQLLSSKDAHSKQTHVIWYSAVQGSDEVRQTQEGFWTRAVLVQLEGQSQMSFISKNKAMKHSEPALSLTCCRKQWKVAMGWASLSRDTSSWYTWMSSP